MSDIGSSLRRRKHSAAYVRFQQSFGDATGLCFDLVSSGDTEGALRFFGCCNEVCRQRLAGAKGRAACRRNLQRVYDTRRCAPASECVVSCPARLAVGGLLVPLSPCETGMLLSCPVRLNGHRVFESGSGGKPPVLTADQFQADLGLLAMFADYLRLEAFREGSTLEQESVHVMRCREMVQGRFREPLRFADVARELGISPSRLSREFHRQTGRTFSEFLGKTRVTDFKRQLLESEESVSCCAFAAGFQSISQANRTFRRRVGMSPSQFRTQV